jgi:hypothetical protein
MSKPECRSRGWNVVKFAVVKLRVDAAVVMAAAAMLMMWLAMGVEAAELPERVDFNRDVRPILSDRCFKCHGPDPKTQEGGLRLDLRDAAIGKGKSGAVAIVPGGAEQSELVRRIFSEDEKKLMPPPDAKRPLTDRQKQVLRRWIEQGAEYAPHWAFERPVRRPLPEVRKEWNARNAIDHFVFAELERRGLSPSAEADRHTLIRRVYLDLIGLVPTPEEVAAFVGDASPDAYEKVVDRLLASERYGERWARRWLDLARYADTNGYEKDRAREIWHYRDWVIRAINSDMPFDRFTIEQLAGDLLPNPTADQMIATGFHRNTMLNEEGGIDPQEFRFYALVDRVNTTATAWLGLTLACAQCHTHKYDPIPHSEYFSLMAFMNQTDEPKYEIPDAAVDRKRQEISQKIAAAWSELPSKWPLGNGDKRAGEWRVPSGVTVATESGSPATLQKDGSWVFGGSVPETDVYTFTFDAPADGVDRIRVEALSDGTALVGRTPHGNFVLTDVRVSVAPVEGGGGAAGQEVVVEMAGAEADGEQDGYPAAHAIDKDRRSGWAVHRGEERITATRTVVFHLKKSTGSGVMRWTVRLEQNYGSQHAMARARVSLGTPVTPVTEPSPDGRDKRREAMAAAFDQWVSRESAAAVKWTTITPKTMKANLPYLRLLDDGSIMAEGDQTKSDTYELGFEQRIQGVRAIRLEAMADESLPGGGPGRGFYEGPEGDFLLSEISVESGGKRVKIAGASHSYAKGQFASTACYDGRADTGWAVSDRPGQTHEAVFVFDGPVDLDGQMLVSMLFERHYSCGLGRFRISVATEADRPISASSHPAAVTAILAKAAPQRTAEENAALWQRFVEVAPELAEARKEIEKLEKSMPQYRTTLVMRERPADQRRRTFVRHRGEYLSPTDEVQPGVLSALHPLKADDRMDRLTLAKWLVSPENPLVGRVVVNRQWQAIFGRGLVRTTEDFGFQGELPSHPQLLDYLAVDFVEGGWTMKRLHRMIVTSTVYRQSSRATPELLRVDPENRLLARSPRVRLEAEMVRDSVLRSAGMLTEAMYGPSVKPPATERRSVYLHLRRTTPYDVLMTFDGTSGESCMSRREASNTPLQALTVLNDEVFVAAARALGNEVAEMKAPTPERMRRLVSRCLTREPDEMEMSVLEAFHGAQMERLKRGELDAKQIAGDGKGDRVEAAAWTLTARAVINLDEMVIRP